MKELLAPREKRCWQEEFNKFAGTSARCMSTSFLAMIEVLHQPTAGPFLFILLFLFFFLNHLLLCCQIGYSATRIHIGFSGSAALGLGKGLGGGALLGARL